MKKALITGKIYDASHKNIFESLQKELKLLNVDSFIFDSLSLEKPPYFDIVFSVGGDGSFVSAARRFVHFKKPIIAIKAGSLTFLENICPEEMSTKLPELFREDVTWSKRMLVSGSTCSNNNLIAQNEFLISDEVRGSLTEFSIYMEKKEIMTIRADGILISTPTGSTAYNLSAGGSIALPEMEIVLITPICAHVFGNHPLIVNINSSIQIQNKGKRKTKVWADGQEYLTLPHDELFSLGAPLYSLSLKTSTISFFQALNKKLGWHLNQTE